MSDRAPRLKDVAELANVSLSAASRILRGDVSRFGDETCRRVQQAAKDLGWRRNLLVDGVRTGKTRMIGVLIPPHDSFWVEVLSGIHGQLAEEDYLPITVWRSGLEYSHLTDLSDDDGVSLINRLLDRRVEGLVLWPTFGLAYGDHLRDLRDWTVPVVMIDHRSDKLIGDSVLTDEERAAELVSDHLIGLGHRKIAHFKGDVHPSFTWAVERQKHCEASLARHPDVQYKCWSFKQEGVDEIEVARAMLSGDDAPTAVMASTDYAARAVYQAAQELRLRIPQDLSVVGFADLSFAETMAPPLTTIRQHPFEIGRRAASLLVDRLQGKIDVEGPVDSKVDMELVVRESSAPPRS